ncbi:hypothetical protein BDR06DRAFT_963316 [Suillus hirtellus]|nr:hypothetical protein BDR06DRAFT_963316 [Suillus hirtellus]
MNGFTTFNALVRSILQPLASSLRAVHRRLAEWFQSTFSPMSTNDYATYILHHNEGACALPDSIGKASFFSW